MQASCLVCLLGYVLVLTSSGFSKSVDFAILTFNDVYDIHSKSSGLGGFAKLKTMLDRERQKHQHHITTMNGDFLFPSMLSTFDKGKHRVELFNAMQVDLVVLGNHEFDFGPQVIKERIAESNFPWFGANVYDIEGNHFTGEKQTHLIDVDGIKIGFFGVITNETPMLSSTENSVLFCPIALTAKRMCDELKAQGADVIVALTHLFIDEDRQLALDVPGIHVILGGHDHEPVTWYENDTLIIKTGQNAYFLGRILLHIEVDELSKKKVKIIPSWKLVANYDTEENAEVRELISGYDRNFSRVGHQELAFLQTSLDSRHSVVRGRESTMANVVLDALKEAFQADAALMSGGILRGDHSYPADSWFTYEDLLKELAFDNTNVVIEISGQDILKVLEHGVSQCQNLSGRFPQVSGIEYTFNEKSLPGERILDVKIGGQPLNKKKKYRLATNTYNQKGGDGYYALCNGEVVISGEKAGKLIDTVQNYLKRKEKINMLIQGRIRSFPNNMHNQ